MPIWVLMKKGNNEHERNRATERRGGRGKKVAMRICVCGQHFIRNNYGAQCAMDCCSITMLFDISKSITGFDLDTISSLKDNIWKNEFNELAN